MDSFLKRFLYYKSFFSSNNGQSFPRRRWKEDFLLLWIQKMNCARIEEGERKECDINGTSWGVSKWEREMGKSCAIKNYSSWGRNEKVDGINCLHDWASPRTGKGENYKPTVRRSSRKIFPRSWIKSKGPWRREEKNKRKKWPKSSKNSKMRKRSSWNNCVRSAPWKWKRVKTATQKRTTESENWRRNLPPPPKTSRTVNKASNITSWSWSRPSMNWKLPWPDLPISKNRQVHFCIYFSWSFQVQFNLLL